MAKREQKSKQLPPIYAVDLSGGVQNRTLPALSSDNQVAHCLNGLFGKKIGAVVGRYGTVVTKAVGSVDVDNILVYRNGDTRKYIVIANDADSRNIYTAPNSDFSGTHTLVLDGHFAKDSNVFHATFAKKLFLFNGVTAPRSYDGTTFAAITNAPTTGKYPAVFKQALWVLGTDGFLHYSDVINATGDGFTSDTWENIGINPNDGQKPRALVRHRGYLIIFKEESIYRHNGTSIEPEPTLNIGTPSERGVAQTNSHIYFFHSTGLYRMSLGDPVCISRGVQKYIDGMSSANIRKVSVTRDKNSNILCYIGDTTISDPMEWDYQKTYEDVCLVWDYELERWTVFTNWNATKWCYDTDNGTLYFVTDTGNITKVDPTRFNDNGTPIDFQIMWNPINYGVPQSEKTVDHIFLACSPNVQLKAGDSSDAMDISGERHENNMTTHINADDGITFYELWVSAHESYSVTPPYITQLYIGDCYARDTV